MFKKFNIFIGIILLAIFLTPTTLVNAASSSSVHNEAELKQALTNESISNIVLANDIETTEKINILRPVTIDGANHTIKYIGTFGKDNSKDNTIWGGIYVLQVYKTNATIKNIKLTGGNAGLLINGSTVKFEGTIDVSSNGFGGIELGKGNNVTTTPSLILDGNSKIINTTESASRPTIWVPKDTSLAILEINGVRFNLDANEELTIDLINELANTIENPNTSDSLMGYLFFIVLPLSLVYFITKKIKLYS